MNYMCPFARGNRFDHESNCVKEKCMLWVKSGKTPEAPGKCAFNVIATSYLNSNQTESK